MQIYIPCSLFRCLPFLFMNFVSSNDATIISVSPSPKDKSFKYILLFVIASINLLIGKSLIICSLLLFTLKLIFPIKSLILFIPLWCLSIIYAWYNINSLSRPFIFLPFIFFITLFLKYDKYNIAEINGVHSQLETWLSKFRGVSTRHLQQYLNWFAYIFMMKKRFELKKLKIESYKNIIIDNNYIKSNSIFQIHMPIDLNIAYAEYHW